MFGILGSFSLACGFLALRVSRNGTWDATENKKGKKEEGKKERRGKGSSHAQGTERVYFTGNTAVGDAM